MVRTCIDHSTIQYPFVHEALASHDRCAIAITTCINSIQRPTRASVLFVDTKRLFYLSVCWVSFLDGTTCLQIFRSSHTLSISLSLFRFYSLWKLSLSQLPNKCWHLLICGHFALHNSIGYNSICSNIVYFYSLNFSLSPKCTLRERMSRLFRCLPLNIQYFVMNFMKIASNIYKYWCTLFFSHEPKFEEEEKLVSNPGMRLFSVR